MFAKRLLQKVKHGSYQQHNLRHGNMASSDLDPQLSLHYGVPSTASILAFDPIQRLLAIGTLDGRIKVIGGNNIEGLLVSPKASPYKSLEFLHNQAFLVSVTNTNDIQIWNLENRCVASSLQWESNITAFSVIRNTSFMYVGDEYGLMSVLKYNAEEGKLLLLPYHVPAYFATEGIENGSIVGVLPQPHSSGNRVLIAYENGLINLWDVSEAQVVVSKGNKDLQLDTERSVVSPSEVNGELPDTALDGILEEKEISSLCWVCGTIVAVGYVDGDIILWNLSISSSTDQQGGLSNGVVKLQLSSGKRRIPVIVLHWAADKQSHNDCKGQLFIYGGDEIGSEEVLTVLSLEWSSGEQILRCVARVDLKLSGSFADMILIPKDGSLDIDVNATLFILTNPGQIHVYNDANVPALAAHSEESHLPTMQFPVVIPMTDPALTAATLSLISRGENSSKALSEIASIARSSVRSANSAGSKWPLTGGIPSLLSFEKEKLIERIYIAGYQDGSVRIWDATYPVLSVILVLEDKVQFTKTARASSPVSALDFCTINTRLAVGNKSGLVFLYKFNESSEETSFHFVTDTKHEVDTVQQPKGLQCTAVFSIINSPIRVLQFEKAGANLAVGFECGRVAMLDLCTFSVLFLTDVLSPSSSVISIVVKSFPDLGNFIKSPKHSLTKHQKEHMEGIMLIVTKNAHISIVDSSTGDMIVPQSMHPKKEVDAISLHVIEPSTPASEVSAEKVAEPHNESEEAITDSGARPESLELHISNEAAGETLSDSVVLLCSKTKLRLYSLKSMIMGEKKAIHKVKLVQPCCWATTFKKKGGNHCGVVLLYETGVIEIRSLPDLKIVSEISLMSILRWNFRANMNKTMSSSDNGLIALANGSELAFISFLAGVNDFRIPESLPSLHDHVLAAAAEAAMSVSSNQKKKQGIAPGILGGIIKGIKGKRVVDLTSNSIGSPKSLIPHLETVFSRDPFSADTKGEEKEVEINLDDIIIDDPVEHVSTSSSHSHVAKKSERDKLFEGASIDTKPRVRTQEEIIAKYRKTGDAASAAGLARDKLIQRQEKLERINRRTEELQNGAENFASMAKELAKAMESRKWYQI
ncbi:hypothetical protein ACHQM5_020785 [Ranunculus cassubicifolius]